jgi:signal transduction histidine kinase
MELCTVSLSGAPDILVARAKAGVAASLFGFSGEDQRRIAGAASALAHAVVDGGGGELRIERTHATLGFIFRASADVWGGANVARLIERSPVEPLLDDETLREALAAEIDGQGRVGLTDAPSRRAAQLGEQLEGLERRRRDEHRAWAQLAHDLKSPLTAIVGALEQLRETPLGLADARFVQVAHSAAKHLRDVVNATQLFALLESNQLALEHQRVALADVMRGARLAIEPRLRAKDVRLETQLPPQELVVRADLARLSQAISLLLDNAAKYSAPASTIELRYAAHPTAHVVEVIDRGVGMLPSQVRNVFDFTARAPTPGTAGERGPGLGLPVARHLARLHGGTITLSSGPSGTVSTLTLPID